MTGPATNATLTMIQAAGTIDAYGDTADDGPVLWEGAARGYLKRSRSDRRDIGGQQIDVNTDMFILLNSAGAGVVEQAGPDWSSSVVTIIDQRTAPAATKSYRVVAMENRAAGLPVDSVALKLQET